MNTPATFQSALGIILNKFMCESCLVYLEDIVVFFKDNHQYLGDTENVLSTLYAASIFFRLKKCHSFATKVEYTVHTITRHKLSITKARTKKTQ